ncbi:arylsulfatase [uncultured Eudoraea sp.]|uniref:arylsulfatase n=1 Tax=uncultured Eudoraea sp. TaxID=1035614 RepID=UPI0026221CAD|nr:arylsulfatase [uncultured Eudoraea sp.]
MKNTVSPLFVILVFLILFQSCESPKEKPKKQLPPNIILILADDMGYSDIGCYGGEINTPVLDQLAMNGLRFTQFYNGARCCPSRASLLTGLYPQQAGIGHMVYDRRMPAFKGDLSNNAVTLAEVLKIGGYSTYMSGKWHITPYVIDKPDKSNWPRQRGFDKFYGMISGAGSHYDPRSLAEDNEYVPPSEDFYSTIAFTDYAVKCIKEHNRDSPFFLYLSYSAPHWPMQAPQEAIAEYKGKYDKGWDEMRKVRLERMKKMGLAVKPWSENVPDKAWELANMETYAAMTTLMDEGIGKVVDVLEAKGQLENTVIFYLQDNGACAEELDWIENRPTEKEVLTMAPDEVQTEMIPFASRDGKPIKIMKEGWPGPADGYTAYGLNWANASNTPFREYKHWVHEGGIATPLIVHWPAKIKKGGELRKIPTHLIDIMATCMDMSGLEYPVNYNGNAIHPMEGTSLVPVLEGKDMTREAIYWEHEGNRAVRMGKWKLVSKASKKNSYLWDKTAELELKDWELFDIEKDRIEMHDMAATNPEMVKTMAQMWLEWGKRTGIVPRPEKK